MLRTCCALILLLLCLGYARCKGNDTATDGQNLAQKVLEAAEQQDFKRTSEKVVSGVIKEVAPAELANGDGDIATTGACAADVDALCLDVPPGEGRLASCVVKRIKDEEKGNVTGRRVSGKCKKEVAAFFEDRGTNVNKNLQLATACKKDVTKHCSKVKGSGDDGAIYACLRENKSKLSPPCKKQVLKAMIAAANDYRSDAQLNKACTEDAKRLCADVPNGEGRVQACLRSKAQELNWDCQEQLFRQQVEGSDDIRLNVVLFKACRGDQRAFCADVPYGANRVKDCLEEHRAEPSFTTECKRELEAMMARRAADFRLDPALKTSCQDDIKQVCGYEEHGLEAVQGYDARVVMCLQDFRSEIKVAECAAAVKKVMERASQDIRFDEPLADHCAADREQFCAGAVPGSARVIRCLQDHRASLSYECRATLFDHEVRLAEDIDFQFPLRRACSSELTTLCTKVQRGHARVVRCLHRNVESRVMTVECKREVRRNMNRMAQDYRLNFRLNKACDADIQTMCKNTCSPTLGQACGGTVLRCLQENMEKLSTEECKKEVFYFVKMEVSDFRNDVMLAEACKADVEKNCADVELGEGRVLECLRMHRGELTQQCRSEELKLSQLQAKDVRLRPRIMKLCGEEMVVFCKNTKPGSGRMFTCLLENAQKPTFSSLCRDEIVKREDRMKSDYRLDAGVSKDCAKDIEVHCADAKAKAHGKAEVLKCLADKMLTPASSVSDSCQMQMSRAVRMAFWDYRNGTALTVACDEDVQQICPATSKSRGVFTIGVVGRCLTKQLASGKPLTSACRKLVTVAAPKDIRLYLQDTMNPDGSLKVGYLTSLYNKASQASSAVTLSGWVAVLSIVATVFVVIIAAIWGFRRYTGLEKPHTQFITASGKGKPGL